MITARFHSTATLLQDGRVLVVGGRDLGGRLPVSGELYEPRTGLFAGTGSMKLGRIGHTATLLVDGRVLVTGGFGGPANEQLSEAELYDPRTGVFSPTGSMAIRRSGQRATLLPDGRVLIAGGGQSGADGDAGDLASAELYDPRTGTFAPLGSMAWDRAGLAVISLSL